MPRLGLVHRWSRWAGALIVCGCGPQIVVGDGGETGADTPDDESGASTPGNPGQPTTTWTPMPDPDSGSGDATTAPPDPPDTTSPGTTDGPVDGSTDDSTDDPTGDSTDDSTDGSTTDGPDEPGGAGPDAMPDDANDVTLPGADVIAAAVYTDGEWVDFRAQFAAPPFGDETTYSVTWCIAYDGGGTGSCATHASDIDEYLSLSQVGPSGQFVVSPPEVDACEHTSFEAETNTVRVLVPADDFPGTADFRWLLTVTFGGSFGVNEWVPEVGDLDVAVVAEFPPFAGEPSC